MKRFIFTAEYLDSIYSDEPIDGLLSPTPSLVELGREFALEKWKERQLERGCSQNYVQTEQDLSFACKFCSLFSWVLFGGTVQGNWHHQFSVTKKGDVIDLTEGARMFDDFDKQGVDPYEQDPDFFGNEEHIESLESCFPRVSEWVNEFLQKYGVPENA